MRYQNRWRAALAASKRPLFSQESHDKYVIFGTIQYPRTPLSTFRHVLLALVQPHGGRVGSKHLKLDAQ